MLGARFHRGAHLGSEPAAKIAAVARQVAAVEPGGARRADLRRQVHVRAHGERHALAALAVLEVAQLDDGAGPAIARRLDVRKLDVVGAPVDPVDDRIGPADQFVMEAAIDQPADHRLGGIGREHIAGGAAVDAAVAHRLVHPLDDVVAFAQIAQVRLRLVRQRPLAGRDLAGEAEAFQLAQPSHP